MIDKQNLKRPLLYLLVGSVLLGALLGIIVVLRNTWGWFEVRVILTTITVAIASLCGLACDLSRTPRGANVLPACGLALTLFAAGLLLTGIWCSIESEVFWKTTVVASVFCVATIHVCLLSIARLAERFRWVFLVACQVIYGLAILLTLLIVWEIDDEGMFRIVVTVSIVGAALTLVIPLLHRISKTDKLGIGMATTIDEWSVARIDDEIAVLKRKILELEKLRANLINEPARPKKDLLENDANENR